MIICQSMIRRVVCLLLLCSFIAGLSSQNIVVTELPTQSLLPTSPVHRVLQDSEGYMWYATEGGGLCRDDGYELTIFRSPFPFPHARYNIFGSDSILNNYVNDLAEDKSAGHIWFATREGLYRIDKGDYSVKPVSHPKLRHSNVWRMLAHSDGSIWAVTGEGIFSIDSNGENVRHYPVRHDGKSLDVNFLHEDNDRILRALCTHHTMLRYDVDTDSFVGENIDLPADPVYMAEGASHGSFFVATWGGGIVLCTPPDSADSDRWKVTELPATSDQTTGCYIALSLIYDHDHGLLWVAALDNLYTYRVRNDSVEPFPSGLSAPLDKKVIDHLFKDRNGNIWVPGYTPHTFIISYDKDRIERHTVDATRRATGYPLMADVVVKDGDFLWIWQGRDNLSLYNTTTDEISYLSDRQRNVSGPTEVRKCLEKCGAKEGIWAADGNRLLHISHKGKDIVADLVLEIENAGYLNALHENEGNLFIGTDNAIYQMNTLNTGLRRICDGIGEVRQIAVASDGYVFAATGKRGLVSVDKSGITDVIASGENFNVVAISPNATVWTATEQGNIYSYNPQSGTLVCENDNCLASGENIKGLLSDRSGHIWMLADQYVKEYNPDNKAFRIYHTSDERIGMDYMHSVRLIDDNRVCIGGMGALCYISTSADLDKSIPSAVKPVVTSLKTYRRHILNGSDCDEITLDPDEIDFKVTFSTLDHLHAGKVSYAYRLAGIQENWTHLPVGNNTAYFSQIPKGRYCLELRATDRYGCWGEPAECLTIRRLPAWYETWWAFLIYAAVLIAVAYGARWLYRKTNQLLELHRRRKEVVLNSVEINIDDSSLPKFDKEFLHKAAGLVESHIEDSGYNVEQLGNDMCMSRMSLYRKLRTQTGQSPTEFIRNIRLKKAASLLTTTNLSVKEVMQRCGFSTPAYFSRMFREMFGVVPGQYRSRDIPSDNS